MAVNESAHVGAFSFCLCVCPCGRIYICMNAHVHNLPACTASTLKVYHIVLLRPQGYKPVELWHGADGIGTLQAKVR